MPSSEFETGSTGAGSNVGGSPGTAGDGREQLDRILAPDRVNRSHAPTPLCNTPKQRGRKKAKPRLAL